MSLYLLDTNTVSFALRGHAGVDAQLEKLALSAWCISAITASELLYGLARRPNAVKLHRLVHGFLGTVRIEPWDHLAAEQHAHVRARLKTLGTPIGDFDEMIAGHALSLGAALVTDNERHFNRVEGLRTLNWVRV